MNRRMFLKNALLAAPAGALAHPAWPAKDLSLQAGKPGSPWNPAGRPAKADRRFTSHAVEEKIAQVSLLLPNPALVRLFQNCYPNTLDTTVDFKQEGAKPDTFVITGDIDAMWLRDSTAQITPYLPLAAHDASLKEMIRGLIHRQAWCILIDPYANAFYSTPKYGPWRSDETDMAPGVHERKWEIDSLCYPIRLGYKYWKATGDATPLDDDWWAAARRIVDTFKIQQRIEEHGPYRFARETTMFYDNSPNKGSGNPTRKIGLIHSAFRPSDDACLLPFLVPSNLFARRSLLQLAELSKAVRNDTKLAEEASSLASTLERSLRKYAVASHPVHGSILPYEIDGYGNLLLMDDANAPGLLSLPYLECCSVDDPLYLRTRGFVLSEDNPYFFKGKYAEGVGGPHVGPNRVWPLSIIMRALTSRDDREIARCLGMLLATDAGTGFMHESFNPDNPQEFTRPWFAWCNSLFGELIVRLAETRPQLLRSV